MALEDDLRHQLQQAKQDLAAEYALLKDEADVIAGQEARIRDLESHLAEVQAENVEVKAKKEKKKGSNP